MLYVLSKLLDVVTRPSVLLLLICVAGLLLTLRYRSSRWGRGLLVTGIGGFVIFALLPVGTWMLRPLENRFPPPNPLPADVRGIIVLGGAISVNRSMDRGMPMLNDAAGRMTAFLALAQKYPDARLVFTGGNSDPFESKQTEADIARKFLRDVGIEAHRIELEFRSRNTYENAQLSRELVKPKPGERWILVTSAADMPRAVGCFRAAGWPVVAYPADYHTLQHRFGFAPGLVNGLRNADWAAHEWIGLAYYYIRGWTSELYPGPAG